MSGWISIPPFITIPYGLKKELPYNMIIYKAANKLTETTSNKTAGLHTNRFNANIVSHEFLDGTGTIIFDDDVTTILAYAFYSAPITELIMPNSVTTFTSENSCGAFYLSTIEKIKLPDNLTKIPSFTFTNCSNLTSVIIPEGLISIDNSVFNNTSLTSVTIPSTVTTIGNGAFSQCRNLTSITFLGGNIQIGSGVFDLDVNLQKVIVKNVNAWSGNSYGNLYGNPLTYAHYLYSDENTLITDLIISNEIGPYAFVNCYSITSITLNNVQGVSSYAFSSCLNLLTLIVNGELYNTLYISNNNFYEIKTIIVNNEISLHGSGYCFGSVTDVYIKDVNSWGKSSFSLGISRGVNSSSSVSLFKLHLNNLLITNLELSDISIGLYSFAGCSNIVTVLLNNIYGSIGLYAFYKCPNLESVISRCNNDSEISSINGHAFSECTKLVLLDFDNFIHYIYDNIIFATNTNIIVKLRNPTPPGGLDIFTTVFYVIEILDSGDYTDIYAKVYVPLESLNAYETLWPDSQNHIYSL